MFRNIVKWARLNPAARRASGLIGRENRRNLVRLLGRVDHGRSIRRALGGNIANLDDIEKFIRARLEPVRAPLALISQVHRSGGTLLSQLFDGHPALAAHPHELKIGVPTAEDWPVLAPSLGARRNFLIMYEAYIADLMRRGFKKGDRDPERLRFFLVPSLQFKLFKSLFRRLPPASAREILDYYFTAYFGAWLNYNDDLARKRWITAFSPRLAHHEASVAGFFASYPDGRLIQILRDPKSWFPSASSHGKSGATGRNPAEVLDMWCTSAESILRNKARYGDKVTILRFEDLVDRTEPTMRRLTQLLGIDYDPILLKPTFNGQLMRANSSFDVDRPGIIAAPLTRGKMLSEEDRALVDKRCGALYRSVLSICTVVEAPAGSSAVHA